MCVSTWPGIQATHQTFDPYCGCIPVNISKLLIEHSGIFCRAFSLLLESCRMIFNSFQSLYTKLCSCLCQFVMQAFSCLIFCDRHFNLLDHVACIQSFVHLHCCNTCHFLAIDDRPLDWRGTTVFRK